MKLESRIFVAGHKGLVGSAVVRKLQGEGHSHLLLADREELDLLKQDAVDAFFKSERPNYVIVAAAKVGGIVANSTQQADFLYENLVIAANVIGSAFKHKVTKLLFLGSSCIYPRESPQPIKEEYLLTGPLEETNEGYAVAKIAGLKLCEMFQKQYGARFISAMPTNLYGPNDNFHPEHSHVIPGMMRRFHEAKANKAESVTVWGDGSPRREFLHVDDLASALYHLLLKYEDPQTINVGSGQDLTIKELSELMQEVVGFEGKLIFDTTKPSGMPKKRLDTSKINSLGWQPAIPLRAGLASTYKWAGENKVFEKAVASK